MKKSLIETNPYLKDPEMRKKLLGRSAISSSAIEGIYVTEEDRSLSAKTGLGRETE